MTNEKTGRGKGEGEGKGKRRKAIDKVSDQMPGLFRVCSTLPNVS